jgi:hypothetical protein
MTALGYAFFSTSKVNVLYLAHFFSDWVHLTTDGKVYYWPKTMPNTHPMIGQ